METTIDEPKTIQAPGAEPRPTAKPRSKPSSPPEPAEPGAAGHLLGADGRELAAVFPESGLPKLCEPLTRFAERNPTGAALLSLGVGLVVGAILGAAVKRD